MTHPIFVTGPQRAGSRLASHIIARQTGREFIDELDYSPNIPMNSVIQAPFLLKAVIELSFMFPTAQFAFMYRNVNDIVKSMERIEWYKDYIVDPDFYSTFVDHCYTYIEQLKNELIPERWFDIHYESLVQDPLFVKDRSNFTVKQYLPDKPDGPETWRNDEYIRTVKK
jgi:hypothetical protein|tara:strand:- start:78 stop:584 length:507 start_codon:yes stop_codon:yes gene_type:complete